MLSKADRVRGMLLGGALGDALGAGVEFQTLEEIRRVHGPDGIAGFTPAYGGLGRITDDTQMTLFTAEGLLRAHNRFLVRGIADIAGVIHYAYLRWLDTQGEYGGQPSDYALSSPSQLLHAPELRHRRAPGNTCLAALRTNAQRRSENPMNNSKGCGAVMRTSPMALAPGDVFSWACKVGAITHGHPSGYLSAGALTLILASVLDGKGLDPAIDQALGKLTDPDGQEVVKSIQRARVMADDGEPAPEAIETLGGGWVGEEALSIALYCSLAEKEGSTDAFRRALLLASNHSGDSDSTAALTGNLLGAAWGASVLPADWLDELEARAIIDDIAEDLIRHFVDPPPSPPPPEDWPMMVSWPQPDDLDRYPPG